MQWALAFATVRVPDKKHPFLELPCRVLWRRDIISIML